MRRIRIAALAGLALLAACQDATAPRPDQPVNTGPAEGQVATQGEVRRGWIFGPDGNPLEVSFEVHGGLALMEGDIYLGPADSVAASREELLRSGGAHRGVIRGSNSSGYRWSGGSVPYTMSGTFTSTQRQTILNAMAHIAANNPGVSFTPLSWQSGWVSFVPDNERCYSEVGRQGGRQEIHLTSGCASSRGTVVHEILHALGMWHEQSRCNRDFYVQILTENILSGKEDNFKKHCSGNLDVYAYDEGSIMHYGPYAFSKNGQPTIRSLRGLDYLMGQRTAMSPADVKTVHYMYAPPVVVTGVTYPNNVPTITWSTAAPATRYDVYLVVEEYFRDAYENRSTTNSTPVGSTTATSFQDPYNRYTGTDVCDYSGANYTHEFFYHYEVVARFPSGSQRAGRGEARVARC
jgi:astacin